jgi:uncharacterized membrane protein YbhN (UPF0104 family)
VLVIWFAGDTLRQGWARLSTSDIHIQWPWVAVAAVLYVAGLAPMALYWRSALGRFGQHPALAAVVRAYYLGHLGKYVPGKALVAILRTGALVTAGCEMRQVLVSVFLETLTFMATGGALAAMLLATSGDASPAHALLAAGLAVLAGLPVLPPIARRLASRVIAGRQSANDTGSNPTLPAITFSLTAWGIACAVVAWVVLGLSLWATLRAVGVAEPRPLAQLPLWVEAVTLPVVAGFLSLIPGGLLVRDALQVELLATTVTAEVALVAAALWRVISVASEVVTCVILEAYRLFRPPHDPPADPP